MILGDKNNRLLVTEETITVIRSNSIVTYSNDFRRKIDSTVLRLPKVFKNKAYDCQNHKIVSVQTGESREIAVDGVIDFHKVDKQFFFVTDSQSTGLMLHTANGESVLRFSAPYFFDVDSLFFTDSKAVIKFDMKTRETSKIQDLHVSPNQICVDSTTNPVTVIFSDTSNKIHIQEGTKNRTYHWMSKRIEYLKIHDEYVLAVSKSGDVARFHIRIQKIEPLFKFQGDFIDANCLDNRLVILTSNELSVFDLVTGNVIFRDILVTPADFKAATLCEFVSNNENADIFNRKKHSTVEIQNSLCGTSKLQKKEYVLFTSKQFLFILDPEDGRAVSKFCISGSIFNQVSGSHLFSFTQRRSILTCSIFEVFLDRVVLTKSMDFNWKGPIELNNVFMTGDKTFFQIHNTLHTRSLTGFFFPVKNARDLSVGTLKFTGKGLFLIDEKGILNLCTGKYEIKQKKVLNCADLDGNLVFFIEDKGIYHDTPERKQLLEITNVLDLQPGKIEKEEGVVDGLRILYFKDGRYLVGEYIKVEDKLVKVSDYVVDNQSSRILVRGMQVSKSNLLLVCD